MPCQEVLILAMSKMLSGICAAGFTRESDPLTGLRWVRPVRDFGTLLPGDLADADGRLPRCGDVVELSLLSPRPQPPHTEDWVMDCIHHRPRLLRHLEGGRRAEFLPSHLDRAPEEVLLRHERSLCLVQPEQVWARFQLDRYSGKYEARMGFLLAGDDNHPQAASPRGAPVCDLRWQALGREWLGAQGGSLAIDHAGLMERLGTDALYLTLGLSRLWKGQYWPLVVGVHGVPDYETDDQWRMIDGH